MDHMDCDILLFLYQKQKQHVPKYREDNDMQSQTCQLIFTITDNNGKSTGITDVSFCLVRSSSLRHVKLGPRWKSVTDGARFWGRQGLNCWKKIAGSWFELFWLLESVKNRDVNRACVIYNWPPPNTQSDSVLGVRKTAGRGRFNTQPPSIQTLGSDALHYASRPTGSVHRRMDEVETQEDNDVAKVRRLGREWGDDANAGRT